MASLLLAGLTDLHWELNYYVEEEVPEGFSDLVRATRLAPEKAVSISVRWGTVDRLMAEIIREEEGWTAVPDGLSFMSLYKRSG